IFSHMKNEEIFMNFEIPRERNLTSDSSTMQLHIRGQSSHVIDCEGSETISQIKERVAELENIPVEDVCLYCSGSPLSEDALITSLQSFSIDVSVPLKGGKVHGSLARAGKVKGQTPKVDKQEKKKKKTGRAKRRIQYNRRFVNVVQGFGRRRGPNANS
ncbi:hypothetical protein L9F63_015669, partial [Diploptera punctata]